MTHKHILIAGMLLMAGCASHPGIASPTSIDHGPLNSVSRTNTFGGAALASKNIRQLILSSATAPHSVATGADGNVYVGEFVNGVGGAIARVAPSGRVTQFQVPGSGVPNTLAAGIGRAVWFTDSSGGLSKIDSSGHIRSTGTTCTGDGLTAGPDGNMWYSDPCNNSIDRITPAGVVTKFPLPHGEAAIAAMTAGPDGNIWFADFSEPLTTKHIGKVTTAGQITIFTAPNAFELRDIISGPDGNLYVGDLAFQLFRVTPSGSITPFQDSLNYQGITGMAVGADRQIWLVTMVGQLQKFDPVTSTFSNVINLPSAGPKGSQGVKGITLGPDGDMYFASGDTLNSPNYVGVYEEGVK